MKNGCVDVTGPKGPESKGGGECPGLVACNVIQSKAGQPMCGSAMGEWGLPAGGSEAAMEAGFGEVG